MLVLENRMLRTLRMLRHIHRGPAILLPFQVSQFEE